MVGGPIVNGQEDYSQFPFNLATEGRAPAGLGVQAVHARDGARVRQVRAGLDHRLRARRTSSSPTAAARSTSSSTTSATRTPARSRSRRPPTISDNTVYSQVGINVGTKRIARFARRAGIRTPVSDNYAMILGGLEGRRLAAGHGPRVRDVRRGRPEGVQPGARRPEQGPDRDRADLLPDGVPAEDRGSTRPSTSGCSRRRSPRSSISMLDRRRRSPAPARRPRSRASTSPARPARPPTTPTPGSSAGRRS